MILRLLSSLPRMKNEVPMLVSTEKGVEIFMSKKFYNVVIKEVCTIDK